MKGGGSVTEPDEPLILLGDPDAVACADGSCDAAGAADRIVALRRP